MKKLLAGGMVLLSLLTMVALTGCKDDPGPGETKTSRIKFTGIPNDVVFIMVTASTDDAGASGAAVQGGYFDAAKAQQDSTYTLKYQGDAIASNEANVGLYDSGEATAWLMAAQLGTSPVPSLTSKTISGTGNVLVVYSNGASLDPNTMSRWVFSSVSFNAETITLNWAAGVDPTAVP
jgi:hypothetical protein